jgi:hypothetical protein
MAIKPQSIRLVKVQATTNNITRGIVNYLNARGHYAFRVNSTGIWDPVKKVFRRPVKGSRGVADVICCLHYVKEMPTPSGYTKFNTGLFLAIEIKNERTRDKKRAEQIEFSEKIAKAGGVYIITKSYFSFVDWYEKQDFEKEVKI